MQAPKPPKPDREHSKKRRRPISTYDGSMLQKSDEEWGVGNATDSRAFRKTKVGDTEVELIHGEHPHSRCDNSIYARFPNGSIEGFDGHYALTSIEIEESNYLKTSGLSGNEVRKACNATIDSDGEPIYTFFSRTADDALVRAQHVLLQLYELPFGLFDEPAEDLVGRKIFYHDQPAVITRFWGDQGAVFIEPEKGTRFKAPAWAADEADEYEADAEYSQGVKDDILSPHIWWFRD